MRTRLIVIACMIALHCALVPAQEVKENADFKLAVGLYNDGMYDLAIDQLKNFINAFPTTAQGIEARFYLGLSQLKMKRFEDARSAFQNFALSYPENAKAPDAWIKVGEAFVELKNDHEAAAAFERVKVFHPKSALAPEGLLRAGIIYRRLGERESTKRILRSIIQDYPTSKQVMEARLTLGQVYADEGQMSLAEQEMQRIRQSEASPDVKATALIALGKIQVAECIFDRAESTFTSILRSNQHSLNTSLAAFELGNLALSAEDYSAAIRYFTSAASDTDAADSLRAEASYQNILTRMREVFSGYGSFEKNRVLAVEALKSLEEFLARFPNSHHAEEAHLMALPAARLTGSTDAAIRHVNSLLASATAPQIRKKALFLGALASEEGRRFDQSIRYYTTFINEFPDDPRTPLAYDHLGDLYSGRLNNPRRALVYYEDYVLRYPHTLQVSSVLLKMGRCYSDIGEISAAYEAYEKAINAEPDESICSPTRDVLDNLRYAHPDLTPVLIKLTQLVQESFGQPHQSRVAFLYHLGMLYFDDLRNYEKAAALFDSCIAMGMGGDSLVYAKYYLARSYDRLSYEDSTLAPRATKLYDELMNANTHSGIELAIPYESYKFHVLRTMDARIRVSLGKEYLSKYPRMEFQEKVLSDIIRFSLDAGDSVSAADALDKLITRFPHTPGLCDALRLRGELLLRSASADTAIACWKRALSAQPPRSLVPKLWMDIAGAYHDRKEFAKSTEFYQMLTDSFPDFLFAWPVRIKLAEDYMQMGNYPQAVALYEGGIQRPEINLGGYESDPDVSLYGKLGTAYEKMGNYPEAIHHYRDFLDRYRTGPIASNVFYALGGIARTQGNNSLAASYFRQAATVGERSTVSREIADLLFQSEQYTDAERQYSQLARSTNNPDSLRYFRLRAILSTLRMDKLSEAQPLIATFEETFKNAQPELAEIEYEKGLHYYRMQEYVSATKTFEKVSNDRANERFAIWSRYYTGKIDEVTNRLEDAAKIYEELLTKSPDSDVIPRALLSLGNMHFNAERFEETIKYFQEILKNPDRAADILPYAMNNLIEAYESLKLYDAALKTTRDFIDRYPDDESIAGKKIKIGTLSTRLGYYDQAVTQFQSLLSETGSAMEAELRYNIGEAYYYKGDYQQAILEFLKVPYLVTKQGKVNWTATSLYMAGQSYEKMSKPEDALGMYQQIIDRAGIDATFKAAARKEIDRVKGLNKKGSK